MNKIFLRHKNLLKKQVTQMSINHQKSPKQKKIIFFNYNYVNNYFK